MNGVAPFYASYDVRYPPQSRLLAEDGVITKAFSSTLAAHDWLILETSSNPNATGHIQIHDSMGVLLFFDFLTSTSNN